MSSNLKTNFYCTLALSLMLAISQSTNAQTLPAQAEYDALIAFYNSTGGPNWDTKFGWSTANPNVIEDVSTWFGITTTNGHVTGIDFSYNNISGPIPPEIGNLTELITFRVNQSGLNGSLPSTIGNLTNLQVLDLLNCQLSGAIPSQLGSLSSLKTLSLYNNQFTGAIPAELGNLSQLEKLYLGGKFTGGSQLTGSIPPQLGNLNNLLELSITHSQLTGSIPSQLGSLSSLKLLILANNELSGAIPSELGNLTNLEQLTLANCNLTGSIPSTFQNFTVIRGLQLYNNNLSGSIPSFLGDLTALVNLHLQDNQFTGSIPPQLGNLLQLEELILNDNQLTGSIPYQLGNLNKLYFLGLVFNQLSGTIPAQLGNLSELTALLISGNQLSGSVPVELGNLPKLQTLYLLQNQLTSLPSSLAAINSLKVILVSENRFGFESVEPFFTGPGTNSLNLFSFQPQQDFDSEKEIQWVIGSAGLYTPDVLPGGVHNQYQWQKKNGSTYSDLSGQTGSTLSISTTTASDLGVYRLKVTNAYVTNNNLYSAPITISEQNVGSIIYVKKGAAGPGDGTSWSTAFPDLQQAISAASSASGNKEIWVARGEYRPTTGADRTISFQLPSQTFMYGGFVGNEVNKSERNWRNNRTVLSGDLGLQFDKTDNSYHVVVAKDVDQNSGIDGFIISHGNANGVVGAAHNNSGGGMLVLSNTTATNPIINNCEFLSNTASQYGGGVANISDGTSLSSTITNTYFNGNIALTGGGVANYSLSGSNSPSLVNCSFSVNSTSAYGGGLANISSDASIINSTFSKNSCVLDAGAIYNGNNSSATIKNSILWKNFKGTSENGSTWNQIVNITSTVIVQDNIIQGGYGLPSDNNIDSDPLFIREPIAAGVYPRTSVIPVATTDPKYENVMSVNGSSLLTSHTYGIYKDHAYNKLYIVGRELQVIDFNNLTNGLPTSTLYPQLNWGRIQNMESSVHMASNKIFFCSGYEGIFSIDRVTGVLTNLNVLSNEPVSPLWITGEDIVIDGDNLYSPIFYRNTAVTAPKTFYGLLELNLQTNVKRWITNTSTPVSIPQVNGAGDDDYWNGQRLYLDKVSNILYFSMGNGVWWWNRTTNATGLYNTQGGMPLLAGNPKLPSNLTTGMYIDHSQNKFYIGTHKGLFVWDRINNTSKVYNTSNSVLINNLVNIIDKDVDNNIIYVSFETGGVLSINTLTGEQKLFQKDVGHGVDPQMIDTRTESVNYDPVDKKLYIGTDGPNGGVWVRDFNNLIPDFGDLSLNSNSPAIDKANSLAYPTLLTLDIAGLDRFVDYPTLEGSNNLDLGAYEKILQCAPLVLSFSVNKIDKTFSFTPILSQGQSGCNIIYAWNFGDGTTSQEASPIHNFSTLGSYQVSLNVSYQCSDCPQNQVSAQNTITLEPFCESFNCNGDGSVSLGTLISASGYKLSVQGKIITIGARAMLASRWPDYVFEKNYSLMSLPDLKKYIQLNNHLPEIPTATQVKSMNGINTAEMSGLLLRKVEELTLHLINLNERLDNIEKKE
jgi:Leucine-rich repeat (LRR) protein